MRAPGNLRQLHRRQLAAAQAPCQLVGGLQKVQRHRITPGIWRSQAGIGTVLPCGMFSHTVGRTAGGVHHASWSLRPGSRRYRNLLRRGLQTYCLASTLARVLELADEVAEGVDDDKPSPFMSGGPPTLNSHSMRMLSM